MECPEASPLVIRKTFLAHLATCEGGYCDDPDDPGGRTYMGLTERSFPFLWGNGPPSRETVEDTLWTEFYEKPRLSLIPDLRLREQLFDFGVNAGPRRAVKLLQFILQVTQDGRLGPQTLTALAARDAADVNRLYVALRQDYYRNLVSADPRRRKFLKGWLARAARFA